MIVHYHYMTLDEASMEAEIRGVGKGGLLDVIIDVFKEELEDDCPRCLEDLGYVERYPKTGTYNYSNPNKKECFPLMKVFYDMKYYEIDSKKSYNKNTQYLYYKDIIYVSQINDDWLLFYNSKLNVFFAATRIDENGVDWLKKEGNKQNNFMIKESQLNKAIIRSLKKVLNEETVQQQNVNPSQLSAQINKDAKYIKQIIDKSGLFGTECGIFNNNNNVRIVSKLVYKYNLSSVQNISFQAYINNNSWVLTLSDSLTRKSAQLVVPIMVNTRYSQGLTDALNKVITKMQEVSKILKSYDESIVYIDKANQML